MVLKRNHKETGINGYRTSYFPYNSRGDAPQWRIPSLFSAPSPCTLSPLAAHWPHPPNWPHPPARCPGLSAIFTFCTSLSDSKSVPAPAYRALRTRLTNSIRLSVVPLPSPHLAPAFLHLRLRPLPFRDAASSPHQHPSVPLAAPHPSSLSLSTAEFQLILRT